MKGYITGSGKNCVPGYISGSSGDKDPAAKRPRIE